jgi:hypothetical protein
MSQENNMDTQPDDLDGKFRQYLELRERKRDLTAEMSLLSEKMRPFTTLVKSELKKGNGSMKIDDAKMRLTKRMSKDKLTRVHLIKFIGLYALGKKVVKPEQVKAFALALTSFIFDNLPQHESWSVSVTSGSNSCNGLTQREAQEVACIDFAAMLESFTHKEKEV